MTDTTELKAGDFVTSGVRLVRPLAEGGMGRVWVAEHLGLHCEVVVKLMAREMAARDDGASRFAREAEIAAAIKSPHVCQVFDHGITSSPPHSPYIVMELLEGRDLGAVIEAGRMAPMDVVTVVVQIGRALTKAHKVSIVHRDIKPENIFLCTTEAGEGDAIFAKLLDFGTARRELPGATSHTMPGQIMGTPYYMSPEQSVGAFLDERSDIWSLGVVAFEALTGTKPFEAPSVGGIALAIHGVLPMPTDRAPELPPGVDAWFARACAQVPQDRFTTVREMANALVEAVTGVAPVDVATEAIILPARSSSAPPRAPTMQTRIDPDSLPPPAPPPAFSSSERSSGSPLAYERLTASLPDRASSQRSTKIAAAAVGLAAAIAMAGILLHRPPSAPETAAPTGLVAAAAPVAPAPVPVEPVRAPEPPAAAPPAPRPSPRTAPHAEARAKGSAKTRRTTTLAPVAAEASQKKGAPAVAADEDLAKLTSAATKHAEPLPAPTAPTPLAPTPAPAPAPDTAVPAALP